jgi:DNA-binding transcriptional MerR regulator
MIYTTKKLTEILGVHYMTLQLWERENIIPKPQRDSSGRRIYSDEDVVKLKEIAEQRKATQNDKRYKRL